MPAAAPSSLSRRALITGALAVVAAPVVLAGCISEPEPAAPTPDETALEFAVASAEGLLAEYTATASVHPALAPRLDPLAADHREHIAVLAPSPSPAPRAEGSPSPTPTPTPTVPGEPAAAVAALAASETAAATALATRLGPIDGDLARTLASVSACRAAHAADLGGAL
jgi:hypothetical protein